MLNEQKEKANEIVAKLYDYLQSLFNTDINGVNDLIENQVIQISGGFARRLYYLQQNVELTPQDYQAFCNNSDIDIFLINSTDDLFESSFFEDAYEPKKTSLKDLKKNETNSSKSNNGIAVIDFCESLLECDTYDPNLSKTKLKNEIYNMNVDIIPTEQLEGLDNKGNILVCLKNPKISSNYKKLKFTDSKEKKELEHIVKARNFIYKKKDSNEYEFNDVSIPVTRRYYDPLVSFEIIDENHILINRKHIFKANINDDLRVPDYTKGLFRYNVINNCDSDINVQIIKCNTFTKIAEKVQKVLTDMNRLNTSINYSDIYYCPQVYQMNRSLNKNNQGVFTELFDLDCAKYTIMKLGHNLSETQIQSNDAGNYYEIEIDDDYPIFKNIDRRIFKYMDYGFKIPAHTKTKLIYRKRESESNNIAQLTFNGYY